MTVLTGPRMVIAPEFAWLNDLRCNYYSQFGEDGVVEAIFKVVGTSNQWVFECGAADGLFFSNSRWLIEHDWKAVLVEGDPEQYLALVSNSKPFADVMCVNEMLNHERRIDDLLAQCGAPADIDLAVIDVDGQDAYLFNQMIRFRPRVVLIEYNAAAVPSFLPALGGSGQASGQMTEKLAAGRYYTAVWRSPTNLIFVSNNLLRLLRGSRQEMLNDVR